MIMFQINIIQIIFVQVMNKNQMVQGQGHVSIGLGSQFAACREEMNTLEKYIEELKRKQDDNYYNIRNPRKKSQSSFLPLFNIFIKNCITLQYDLLMILVNRIFSNPILLQEAQSCQWLKTDHPRIQKRFKQYQKKFIQSSDFDKKTQQELLTKMQKMPNLQNKCFKFVRKYQIFENSIADVVEWLKKKNKPKYQRKISFYRYLQLQLEFLTKKNNKLPQIQSSSGTESKYSSSISKNQSSSNDYSNSSSQSSEVKQQQKPLREVSAAFKHPIVNSHQKTKSQEIKSKKQMLQDSLNLNYHPIDFAPAQNVYGRVGPNLHSPNRFQYQAHNTIHSQAFLIQMKNQQTIKSVIKKQLHQAKHQIDILYDQISLLKQKRSKLKSDEQEYKDLQKRIDEKLAEIQQLQAKRQLFKKDIQKLQAFERQKINIFYEQVSFKKKDQSIYQVKEEPNK